MPFSLQKHKRERNNVNKEMRNASGYKLTATLRIYGIEQKTLNVCLLYSPSFLCKMKRHIEFKIRTTYTCSRFKPHRMKEDEDDDDQKKDHRMREKEGEKSTYLKTRNHRYQGTM